jgi:hypothetical protein
MVLGLAPLPETPEAVRAATTRLNDKGQTAIVTIPREGVVWRYEIEVPTGFVRRIELLDANSTPLLDAELNEYRQVKIAGEGGFFPETASQIRIRHEGSGATMMITLEALDDRTISPAVFDFPNLSTKLGVQEVIDLGDEQSVR